MGRAHGQRLEAAFWALTRFSVNGGWLPANGGLRPRLGSSSEHTPQCRNVKGHLPENCQKDYDRRIRNAYAMTHYEEAKAELEKIDLAEPG